MRFRLFACVLAVSSAVSAESLSLADVYQLALQNDPALSAQISVRDAAVSRSAEAKAARGVSVDGRFQASYSENFESNLSTDTNSVSATLSMPLYNPALDASIEGADARARSANASLTGFRQAHLIDVARAYFDLLSAERDVLASEAEVKAFERQLVQAQERLLVGIGTRVDVDQARARLDLSKVNQIASDIELETRQSDLSQVIGQPVTEVADLVDGFRAEVHRSLEAEIEAQIEAHPEVIARRESVASAQFGLTQARARTAPTLSLGNTLSASETGGDGANTGTSQTNVISLTLSAPLFTNGAADAAIAVAMASLNEAEANLLATRRQIGASMQLAYRALESSARTVEARRLAIVSAASRLEATAAAYEVGSGDIVEVLNAEKDLIAAERDYAKARHAHVIRQLELDRALGVLSEEAIARIEQSLQ